MTPRHLLEILRETRRLVADLTRWTERNFAEDLAGRWVPVGSEHAVKFNLAGATIRTAGAESREAICAVTELLCEAPSGMVTQRWRHARGVGHSEALDLLNWAIGRLEAGVTAAQ